MTVIIKQTETLIGFSVRYGGEYVGKITSVDRGAFKFHGRSGAEGLASTDLREIADKLDELNSEDEQ